MFARTDSVELYYTDSGTGRPLVVHHGGPGVDHSAICPFLGGLASQLRLVCFDHRGTGRSSVPGDIGAYRFEDFVEDLEGLRRHLGVDRFALLGHSFGGMVAQHYALAYPDRLSHLVLVCTTYSWRFLDPGIANIRKAVGEETWSELDAISRAAPSADSMKRSFMLQVPAYFHDSAMASAIDVDQVRWGPSSLAAWVHMAGFDLESRVGGITARTLVIAGRHDRAIPVSFSEELARAIPGAMLEVSEASGHFPFVEDPEWFSSTVGGFVSP